MNLADHPGMPDTQAYEVFLVTRATGARTEKFYCSALSSRNSVCQPPSLSVVLRYIARVLYALHITKVWTGLPAYLVELHPYSNY